MARGNEATPVATDAHGSWSAVIAPDRRPLPRLGSYGLYAAGVLTVAYAFAFLDRQILSLMVGPVERSLHISDSQFALLTGATFGIFYTVMGLPLGWMADRYNRKWLITAGITCWSVMTASCGLARSLGYLMLSRIGVGVGEATLSPSAYSMLSDYFDKARLPRAMSVYACGIFLGAGLAMIIGGTVVSAVQHVPLADFAWLGITRSWQLVFFVVGLPGLLLALWLSTLREPVRRAHGAGSAALAASSPGVRQGLRELGGFLRRYPWMCTALFLGSGLYSILGYTDNAWYPELFIRTWGWTPRHVGLVNGMSSLIAGPLGLIVAGWWAGRLFAHGGVDASLRVMAYGALAITLPAVCMPLAPHPQLMALLLLPYKFFVGFSVVLTPAAINLVAPNRLRGQLSALFLLGVGIIGMSCGPILPALLTDYVFHSHAALRYSLAVTTGVIGPIAGATFWLGLREYRACYQELVNQVPA
jgi:MFS family permease